MIICSKNPTALLRISWCAYLFPEDHPVANQSMPRSDFAMKIDSPLNMAETPAFILSIIEASSPVPIT